MATEILLPQLGMYMFEATIVRWIAPEGAEVQRGDALVEIQTDKVVTTIEAVLAGRLQRVAAEGVVIPVRGILGYLLAPGEAPIQAAGHEPAQARPETVRPAESRPAPPSGEIRASPIARRLAKEHGIDLAEVVGSGPDGRIGEKDVLAAVEARRSAPRPATVPAVPPAAPWEMERPPAPAVSPWIAEAVETRPISGIRQIIFDRMSESAHTTARVVEFTEVDATALVEARTHLKAEFERTENVSVSYNDLFILIVARALREHRLLNSTVAEGHIRLLPHINIGLAVDTARGLLVPVVRDADAKGLRDIVRDVRALVERAQAGRSLPDDLTGGTFTITNLGMYEIDGFTPIINLPECAILGLGRIAARPAVYSGQICIRQIMTLSLSFDHRIVDGAPAARFLQRVKYLVEDPYLLLTAGN